MCADYYATTTGTILGTLIPKILLENLNTQNIPLKSKRKDKKSGDKKILALQAENEDRTSQYRSIIREQFAKGSSVYFCLPTIEAAKIYFNYLSLGIETHSFLFWGGLSKKEFTIAWTEATSSKHPVLIIGTGACFSLQREDIGAIIVEEESSRFYKTQRRPFLDVRTFAEIYAKELGAQYIIGDTLLRIETLWKIKQSEYSALGPIHWKSTLKDHTTLVDMKSEEDKGEKKFRIIGNKVTQIIENAREHKKHIFLFTNRKGYAPSIICRDCRTPATCEKCKAPIAFYKGVNESSNFFLCHRCRSKRVPDTLCQNCKSWRLDPSGIGIDRVKEELETIIPSEAIFTVDREKIKTVAEVKKIVSGFHKSEWGVLLGTEAVFSSLQEKVDAAAILSLDSLFALPDFRINEKIMHLIFKMRSLTEGAFVIQTRNPSEKILEYATEGNVLDFYQLEITEREQFKYPPFATLIEISLSGERSGVEKEMEKIQKEYLKEYSLEIFPAFIPEAKGLYTLKGVIKLPPNTWPIADLQRKLANLPRFFRVKIDPESIL